MTRTFSLSLLSLLKCPFFFFFFGTDDQEIVRVVHCGDAPGDVLAAKYCMEHNKFDDGVAVSCIAVATGRFSAEHLSSLFGDSQHGKWEPMVLEKGLADPSFIDACKINCST
jgi:hypothetical protein